MWCVQGSQVILRQGTGVWCSIASRNPSYPGLELETLLRRLVSGRLGHLRGELLLRLVVAGQRWDRPPGPRFTLDRKCGQKVIYVGWKTSGGGAQDGDGKRGGKESESEWGGGERAGNEKHAGNG